MLSILAGLSVLVTPAQAQDQAAPAEEAPPKPEVTFSLDGYYRARVHHFNGMFDPEAWDNEPGAGRYTQQRLRLQPVVAYGDLAKFTMMADIMDDTLWGDNTGLAQTPLFAETPTDATLAGVAGAPINVKRAWVETKLPVGILRVGRQGSHWGMGILANGGDGFDDTFGENHGGTTFDRVLFATRPISLVQGIRGKEDPGIPLTAIFAIDRLVEDPLEQYYGYQCDPDVDDDDARCDADDDHDYTEPREASDRPANWWTENDDDVLEFVYGLLYRGMDLEWNGEPAELQLGGYAVNRRQVETGSNVWILDAYGKLNYRSIYAEFEALTIQGDSSAITLPGSVNYGDGDPLAKTAAISSYVARVGYTTDPFGAILETGFASGDENASDERFTGRALNPDYNVGLLLYEELIARVSAYTWSEAARGLWSGGGVYNSRYLFPTLRYSPAKDWSVTGGFLVAFPHKPDGAVILTDEDAESPILGWEANMAVKGRLNDVVLLSVEGGYAQLSDRLPWENVGVTIDGRAWTIQSRIAYEF